MSRWNERGGRDGPGRDGSGRDDRDGLIRDDRRDDRDDDRRNARNPRERVQRDDSIARERVQRDDSIVKDEDVEEAVEYLRTSADAAAKTTADYEYLKAYTETVIAEIMKESKAETNAEQKRDALADPRYLAHLKVLRTAKEDAGRHKFHIAAKQAIISAWQTKNANKRTLGDFR